MRTMASSIATSSTTHRARAEAASQHAARSPTVPAPTWPSPGADVAESRRRRGRVPAPMWAGRHSRSRVGRSARATYSGGVECGAARSSIDPSLLTAWTAHWATCGMRRASCATVNSRCDAEDYSQTRRSLPKADDRPLPPKAAHCMRAIGGSASNGEPGACAGAVTTQRQRPFPSATKGE
jgi:hypothetical protein